MVGANASKPRHAPEERVQANRPQYSASKASHSSILMSGGDGANDAPATLGRREVHLLHENGQGGEAGRPKVTIRTQRNEGTQVEGEGVKTRWPTAPFSITEVKPRHSSRRGRHNQAVGMTVRAMTAEPGTEARLKLLGRESCDPREALGSAAREVDRLEHGATVLQAQVSPGKTTPGHAKDGREAPDGHVAADEEEIATLRRAVRKLTATVRDLRHDMGEVQRKNDSLRKERDEFARSLLQTAASGVEARGRDGETHHMGGTEVAEELEREKRLRHAAEEKMRAMYAQLQELEGSSKAALMQKDREITDLWVNNLRKEEESERWRAAETRVGDGTVDATGVPHRHVTDDIFESVVEAGGEGVCDACEGLRERLREVEATREGLKGRVAELERTAAQKEKLMAALQSEVSAHQTQLREAKGRARETELMLSQVTESVTGCREGFENERLGEEGGERVCSGGGADKEWQLKALLWSCESREQLYANTPTRMHELESRVTEVVGECEETVAALADAERRVKELETVRAEMIQCVSGLMELRARLNEKCRGMEDEVDTLRRMLRRRRDRQGQ